MAEGTIYLYLCPQASQFGCQFGCSPDAILMLIVDAAAGVKLNTRTSIVSFLSASVPALARRPWEEIAADLS